MRIWLRGYIKVQDNENLNNIIASALSTLDIIHNHFQTLGYNPELVIIITQGDTDVSKHCIGIGRDRKKYAANMRYKNLVVWTRDIQCLRLHFAYTFQMKDEA